jgi:hypothetical protein
MLLPILLQVLVGLTDLLKLSGSLKLLVGWRSIGVDLESPLAIGFLDYVWQRSWLEPEHTITPVIIRRAVHSDSSIAI